MKEDKEILEEAFRFHGHICWASAVGVRAGLAALRELGVRRTGSSGELHCIVEIGENHGAQCFADGVQFSTGCTVGKGNLEKAGWGKLAITLIDKKKEHAIRVSYKPGRHKEIADSAFMRQRAEGVPPTEIPGDVAWEMANIVWEAPEEEVLSVGAIQSHSWDGLGEIMGLKPCDDCGEMVSVAYLRVVGDKHMCIPCSGYDV